ncbi:hypothetical protein LJB42_000283 [Komagataella kurtzmanii]|nr:hypothetical protein LJB42_000283 [Komagataella kurtzmanii]
MIILLPLLFLFVAGLVQATKVHEAGICALRGNCGKKNFFGSELPCPDNTFSTPSSPDDFDLLEQICGKEFADINTYTCCDTSQLLNLQKQLKKVDPIIASCPACRSNFYTLFCSFTCSPDQSQFVNVTDTVTSTTGEDAVSELDYYIQSSWAEEFFDSCKDIKFGASNGYAMDLIGGGAKNYSDFLKFLGDEKPLLGGSPFQINFQYPSNSTPQWVEYPDNPVRACNDSNPDYKCACSDCPGSCPVLPSRHAPKQCRVGILPCFSFAVVVLYAIVLLGYIAYKTSRYTKSRTSLLLHDDLALDESRYDYSSEDEQFFNNEFEYNSSYYPINSKLEEWFCKLGFFCSTSPKTVIFVSLVVSLTLTSFMRFIELEEDPVKLWVSPQAEAFQQKQVFDEKFGPFYRTQQIFVINETGPVLSYDTLKWWFDKESTILSLQANASDYQRETITLQDLCLKPINDACVVESFTQYFGGDSSSLTEDNWEKKLSSCANSPVNCLPSFQQPLKKSLLFGTDQLEDFDILKSNALVITLVMNNSNDVNSTQFQNSLAWEKVLESHLLDLKEESAQKGLKLSFSTESSLQKELNKSTNTDINIIVISYLLMFLYAAIALGSNAITREWNLTSLVHTRFTLGLSGIIIVLLSVSSSAGFWSIFGLKSTLIIAEVIPFLVLAIGVDNIFLISHELNTVNMNYSTESIPLRVSKAMGKIGPSILLSSSAQVFCFALATVVSMPAVRNFAAYCTMAVLFNCILQTTAFVSLLTLDQIRLEDNRLDVFPFVKVDRGVQFGNNNSQEGLIIDELLDTSNDNVFSELIKKYYAPFIFNKNIKPCILAIFGTFTIFCLSLLPDVQFGLDQRIALPRDSFLIDYFDGIYNYLGVGPPTYFVVDGMNVTERSNQQKLCGRFSTCDEFSLVNVLEQERKRSEISTIYEPTSSWIDDFFLWLNPDLTDCCRFRKGTNQTEMCPIYAPSRQCEVCYENHEPGWNITMEGLPQGEEFMKYFDIWIESPSDPCPLGGKAPYSNSVFTDVNGTNVESFVFRTSHVPLRSQDDFIKAYKESLRITNEVKEYTGIENLFAYSPFYIFFVQYASIVKLTFSLVAAALLVIFLFAVTLLGSFDSALILILTVVMILIDMGGIMALWGINLNAVSLVNILICVGLSVEFCTHIVRGFTIGDPAINFNTSLDTTYAFSSKQSRAFKSLTTIGGSVFGGITLTKIVGVTVLAFTRSQIFEVYYFRMWFSLVVLASLHSLMFLPVILSYVGGRGYISSSYASLVSDELIDRLQEQTLD